MHRRLTAICCICTICTMLFCFGCSAPEPVPDQAAAEQTAVTYMQEKYGTGIRISMSQTRRIGTNRYEQIRFSAEDDDSGSEYEIYVGFDPADPKTPAVVCETYMQHELEPLLTEWLNAQTGAEVAETVNCAQIADLPAGFRSDFPRIETPDEAEALIAANRLTFDYTVYVGGDPSAIEQRIQEKLPLFSDDTVFFHLRKCDAGDFAALQRQYRTDGTIPAQQMLGTYTETVIKSF